MRCLDTGWKREQAVNRGTRAKENLKVAHGALLDEGSPHAGSLPSVRLLGKWWALELRKNGRHRAQEGRKEGRTEIPRATANPANDKKHSVGVRTARTEEVPFSRAKLSDRTMPYSVGEVT